MYHIPKEEIPKSYFPKVGRLEVGQYYALLSYDNIYCFAHVLEITEDFFVAETFYANIYDGIIVYLHRKKGPFIKKREITESIFRQALDLFEKGKKQFLSMEFTKIQLKHEMQFGQFYFYFINNDNNAIKFGYVSDEITFRNRIYEVIEIDLVKDCIVNWRLTDFNEYVNDYCYSIDPMTFDKAKKLFGILDHCIATFMKSYLE
jgi:hypothetical protein